MCPRSLNISESIEALNNNLINVAQVGEWANLMGFKNTKRFSRTFLRHYLIRPSKILVCTRLKSIFYQLKQSGDSNFKIARQHSLPDEKALNKFVNYHLGCCPRQLQDMSRKEFYTRLEKFGSKIEE